MRSKRQPKSLEVCRCYVCTTIVPITFEQEHHVVPQAAGGKDGETRQLCAGCHHNLHRLADMLLGGKASMAEDSAAIAYPDGAVRARAFDLAKLVVEAMTLKRDGKMDLGHPVHLMIALPPQIKLAAQVLANECRGPTGRRLGLARWISGLVIREVLRHYPHLDPAKAL
jgi:hypothetical protein